MWTIEFSGKIISFEPLTTAFSYLIRKSDKYHVWDTLHFVLGDQDAKSEINIAGNSEISSLLDMLPAHVNSAPTSAYVGSE